jgi:hypothetical protein
MVIVSAVHPNCPNQSFDGSVKSSWRILSQVSLALTAQDAGVDSTLERDGR